uniref:Uncharacterized protein n=1 Tax=Branchiostoma floridae TaxID=7739 RepID=C3YWV1_BRAFL|eukprot:XP_002599333.1 hypothetical protein BRAFLDRAFT_117362 [Branchiostoma floridae]
MQTGCAVKSLSQTSVLELMWGVVETQASPDETAEAPRQEGGLPPVHEPLRRRNALGDIFLGIDAERVERFQQDSRGTTAGENTPLASPTEPQDVPRELSRKRRRRVSSLYTTLETIYEEEGTEDSASNELLNSHHSHREVNNNNAAPGLKRRTGLGDIFEGIDETSVEGLRRMFSHDADERRSQDEFKESLPFEGNAKPALKRRKALANIFEGVNTASVKSLRRQYKREASSHTQDTAPTSPSLRQTRHALWHVLETLGVSVQGVRSENSPKIKSPTTADMPSTQQTDEARTSTASRKPVLRRQNASPNLLEGLDAAMLEVLRGEGASSTDNSVAAAPVSDYATFCNSPRATRRRNALTDITDLQKLYQTACKSTGAWLSGMLVC